MPISPKDLAINMVGSIKDGFKQRTQTNERKQKVSSYGIIAPDLPLREHHNEAQNVLAQEIDRTGKAVLAEVQNPDLFKREVIGNLSDFRAEFRFTKLAKKGEPLS